MLHATRGLMVLVLSMAVVSMAQVARAGVVFPGRGERHKENREVEAFYRRFAVKALEMDAWSRGLKDADRRRFVFKALRGAASVDGNNVFLKKRSSGSCSGTGCSALAPKRSSRRGESISRHDVPAIPPSSQVKPRNREIPRMVVLAGSRASMDDVLDMVNKARKKAVVKGWDVIIRILVSGANDARKWMRGRFPNGMRVDLVRQNDGRHVVDPTEIRLVVEK